jgi:hypothetical protein
MQRIILPLRDPSAPIIFDQNRGYLAAAHGPVASIYAVPDDASGQWDLVCSFAASDGPFTDIKINPSPFPDRILILASTEFRISVFSLVSVISDQNDFDLLTGHKVIEIDEFGSTSAMVWDERKTDSILIATPPGNLVRVNLGFLSDGKVTSELIHEFQEEILKILVHPLNPNFIFCLTPSNLFVVGPDGSTKAMNIGIVTDFDISRFGYLAALTETQAVFCDLGVMECVSFSRDFMSVPTIKSIAVEFLNGCRIVCDLTRPNLIYGHQKSHDREVLVKFSFDPKFGAEFCILEPRNCFISPHRDKLVCASSTGYVYLISLDETYAVVKRTFLQYMDERCICDVRNDKVAYVNFEGHLCVSLSRDGRLSRLLNRDVGHIRKMCWFDDDTVIVLEGDHLHKVCLGGEVSDFMSKNVPRRVSLKKPKDFWVLPEQRIFVKFTDTVLGSFSIDEEDWDIEKYPEIESVCFRPGGDEKLVFPCAQGETGLLTKSGPIYMRDLRIFSGENRSVPAPFEGALLNYDDDHFVLFNSERFKVFESASLECEEGSRYVPGNPFCFAGSSVFSRSGLGLVVSYLGITASELVKGNGLDDESVSNLVLSAPKVEEFIGWSLRLHSLFDPVSPDVDEISLLSKIPPVQPDVKKERPLTIDEMYRKMWTRARGVKFDEPEVIDSILVSIAQAGWCRRSAVVAHVMGKDLKALEFLLMGGLFELARVFVEKYGLEDELGKVVSEVVKAMIGDGCLRGALFLLKEAECFRGVIYVLKLVDARDLVTDELMEKARNEGTFAIAVEEAIGVPSLEELTRQGNEDVVESGQV